MIIGSPEEDWDSGKKRSGHAVKVVLLVLVLAGLVGTWIFISGHVLIETREPVDPVPFVDRYPSEPEEAVRLARESWERFVEAPGLSGRVLEVRDRERVEPLIEDFHVRRGHPFPMMESLSEGEAVTLGERRMVLFRVKNFSEKVYPVSVEWAGDRFAVDWESLSAYGTMDWAELIESRPETTHTMRVYLGELPDQLKPRAGEEWSFFRMEHRDSPETVAIAVGGKTAAVVAPELEGKRAPATIEVRWNPEIGQFEIVRLVSWGWSL
ncbi:MAG: hypothetical protein AAGI48_02275 [Verrucomicrobiota bacterium]